MPGLLTCRVCESFLSGNSLEDAFEKINQIGKRKEEEPDTKNDKIVLPNKESMIKRVRKSLSNLFGGCGGTKLNSIEEED